MKAKKVVRAVTLGFALTMLTSYVVYSELTQNRQAAAETKSISAKVGSSKPSPVHLSKQTNAEWSEIIASSSKSKAPLIKVPTVLFQTTPGTNPPALVPELSSAVPSPGSSTTNVIPSVVK